MRNPAKTEVRRLAMKHQDRMKVLALDARTRSEDEGWDPKTTYDASMRLNKKKLQGLFREHSLAIWGLESTILRLLEELPEDVPETCDYCIEGVTDGEHEEGCADDGGCDGCASRQRGVLQKLGLRLDDWDHVVALAGNPNTGKSTVFNAMTGLKQHTGNWPGKTVARAEGGFSSGGQRYKLVDLPGTYSLLSASLDEQIARDFILFGKPDVTVIVVDATRLERNLNLVLQVLEITDRAVLCLNLVDEARRKGIGVDSRRLARDLGIPVVETSARYDEGLDELVVHTGSMRGVTIHEDGAVTAEAGANLIGTAVKCCRAGWRGLESAVGIPGSVGGAAVMNAGAYGFSISDSLREIVVYDENGDRTEPPEGWRFHYRGSSIPEGAAVGAVTVDLEKDDPADLERETRAIAEKRRTSQPGGRNAGCVFKNPEGGHAGGMIDELGLKGLRRGRAVVSPRHANFVVNEGGASADDVLGLIDDVRDRVRAAKGVDLDLEVKVWGPQP